MYGVNWRILLTKYHGSNARKDPRTKADRQFQKVDATAKPNRHHLTTLDLWSASAGRFLPFSGIFPNFGGIKMFASNEKTSPSLVSVPLGQLGLGANRLPRHYIHQLFPADGGMDGGGCHDFRPVGERGGRVAVWRQLYRQCAAQRHRAMLVSSAELYDAPSTFKLELHDHSARQFTNRRSPDTL